jgi:hypothetical protein
VTGFRKPLIKLKEFHQAYGDFIIQNTPTYIQRKPANVADWLKWPSAGQIVDSLSEMARLRWP